MGRAATVWLTKHTYTNLITSTILRILRLLIKFHLEVSLRAAQTYLIMNIYMELILKGDGINGSSGPNQH